MRLEHKPNQDLLDNVIETSRRELEACQCDDGHYVFELEADATIPAEYIMLEHFLGEIDEKLEQKMVVLFKIDPE